MTVDGCDQFRVTRNGDLWIDEEEVEDLMSALKGELPRRRFAAPVRLECDTGPIDTGKYIGPLPTIELTVHTHARPRPGPVAARFRTDHACPRFVEEDGWISDSSGKLVSVSRQIAVLPGG